MEKSSRENKQINKASELIEKIHREYEAKIIGQKDLFKSLIIGLLTSGHILLEGVPGLAKTRSIQVIAKTIHAEFRRVQFTPDLLPSDIIGNQIFNPKEGTYETKIGPVFANIVLADEINRAPAKVQSALLEAMQERQVTIGGKSYELPKPFFVLATQNPIEQEGTYPLPEAQIDRFLLKSVVPYPTLEEEAKMLSLIENEEKLDVKKIIDLDDIIDLQSSVKKIFIDDKIKDYIIRLVHATRNPLEYKLDSLKEKISFGASPRASIAFMNVSKVIALINGRDFVIPEDIKEVANDILRHRVILTYEAEADGVKVEDVIDEIINNIQVP